MEDKYPETIKIDIDRDGLRSYLRVKWLLSWIVPFVVFGTLMSFVFIAARLENQDISPVLVVTVIVESVGGVLLGTVILGVIMYFLFSYRQAARFAESMEVTVEGAFLRIRQDSLGKRDRKLHFRAIVDYATVESRLMRRYGVMSLQMMTIGGGPQGAVEITGIKDCLAVRDMLAEIDSIRENG